MRFLQAILLGSMAAVALAVILAMQARAHMAIYTIPLLITVLPFLIELVKPGWTLALLLAELLVGLVVANAIILMSGDGEYREFMLSTWDAFFFFGYMTTLIIVLTLSIMEFRRRPRLDKVH